jgi:Calx-beta domain/Carboxypeptidase regulatory-like domain/Beta-propeller repeat
MRRVNQQFIIKILLTLLIVSAGFVTGLYRYSGGQAQLVRGQGAVELGPTMTGETAGAKKTERARAAEAYGKLPLSFIANDGQADSQVKFYSRGQGYALFLTPTEAVIALNKASDVKPVEAIEKGDGKTEPAAHHISQPSVLRMKLKSANPQPEVKGIDDLPGKVNYFAGASPDKWHTNVSAYAKVLYKEVYPGIDLIYYGSQRQLEYDFVVAPGADPRLIKLNFEGTERVEINGDGELLLKTKGGAVQMSSPVIYQVADNGEREEVGGQYLVQGRNEIGFQIGDYDQTRTLIIDPVLVYSTYLGGTFSDSVYAITVDESGNAYVTGNTYSTNFPITAGAFQTRTVGIGPNFAQTDAFITKLNPVGSAAVYSTYLGGTGAVEEFNDNFTGPAHGNEEARGIAVDSAGNVFVTGTTTATKDFPVTPGAYRTTFVRAGMTSSEDAFVTKLNAAGNGLIYSTRLGGLGSDQAFDIDIDNDGNAYVTGKTLSADFPLTFGAPSQPRSDVFAVKLNATGTALAYSVLLGRGVGNAIAVDSSGNAYVAGQSYAQAFAVTPGAFQAVAPGTEFDGYFNGFITKINAAGDALLYSTFLGGRRSDSIYDIAVDAAGNAYVVGGTDFREFPTTPGAFMTTGTGMFGGGPFVTKLNPTGSALVYSTYMRNNISAMALNAAGEVYVTGIADGTLTTTDDAFQRTLGGEADAYVTKLNASGSAILYATFLGGSAPDHGTCIAVDNAGSIYLAGLSSSANFPLTPDRLLAIPSGHQFDLGSFVAKIGEANTAQTYRISGRVADAGGNGLARASVMLGGSPGGTQFTDANGNYSFGSLTPGGSYSVTPSNPYYDFNPPSRNFDNLSADQTADFLATVKRYSISGTVKDESGKPLEGVTVGLSGAQSATTLTDANGNYAFNDLSAVGSYTVAPFKTNHIFSPASRTFNNLDGNQTASFTGRLVYAIRGQVVNTAGIPVPGIRINIASGGVSLGALTTNLTGNYSIINLTAGQNYTITPEHVDFTFSPTDQSFNNLSADQTANFTATFRFGSISGRITDAEGRAMNSVPVTLGGAHNATTRTDFNGNYFFSRLTKGSNYTVSASELGYTLSPAITVLTVTADHTANFTASLKRLRPFTSGNIIVTASKYLGEYTPSGTLVQDVIVPSPTADTGNNANYLSDLVLDKNGELKVYNGSGASYLTGYSFTQAAWQHHTYPGWNPWSVNGSFEGIATFGNYVYVTDKIINDFGQPTQTQGIIRIDLNDYSSQRFAADLTFCHLTLGQDGLLYGIVGGTAGNQINVYNPTSMQLLKTIRLTDLQTFPINVTTIAVNRTGEIFATGFYVHHFDAGGKMIKSVQVTGNLTDIEISNSGQLAAAAGGIVTLLDQSLNITGTFNPPTGAGHVAFTNTTPTLPAALELSASSYSVGEGDARAVITVTRTGDISGAVTVKYQTSDATDVNFRCDPATAGQQTGLASRKCDYHIASGRLRFAAGEVSKQIVLSIVDDAYVEGPETFTLTLSNPTGLSLGQNTTATITINDNDVPGMPNPINNTSFYVRQLYVDLLSREPDPAGWSGWTSRIDLCGQPGQAPPPCDRVTVGGDGFLRSGEFFDRQFFVLRLYRTGLGRILRYEEVGDLAYVSGFLTAEDLELNKQELVAEMVTRAEFANRYNPLSNAAYVATLLQTAGVSVGQAIEDSWVASLDGNSKTRAQVLREISERAEVSARYAHEAQVVSAYYGFFTRNPDGAYMNYLQRLDSGEINLGDLANAFINAQEYRQRFGQ